MSNPYEAVIEELQEVLSKHTMEENLNGLLQCLSYAIATVNAEGLLEDIQLKMELISKEMLEEQQKKTPFQPVKD